MATYAFFHLPKRSSFDWLCTPVLCPTTGFGVTTDCSKHPEKPSLSVVGCSGGDGFCDLAGGLNRDQNVPVGSTPKTRLGHVHVHDYRRGTFLLYWNDERIVVFLKHVGSFFRYRTKWLISMPANRQAQLWGVCVWIRRLTIGYDYRGRARGRWKTARRVNGL